MDVAPVGAAEFDPVGAADIGPVAADVGPVGTLPPHAVTTAAQSAAAADAIVRRDGRRADTYMVPMSRRRCRARTGWNVVGAVALRVAGARRRPRWHPPPVAAQYRARMWAAVWHSTRLRAVCGLVGPALFTAAWAVGSLRQTGHPAVQVQLSGLAAADARDPEIMIAGFVALGVGSIMFGTALGQVFGPRAAGPRLITVGGAAAVAAGLLRRDHMLLIGAGFSGESWHNQAHDLVSGVAYAAMIAAPLVLARRFRADPDWAALRRPVLILTLASAAALALFASRGVEPWNGGVQRIAVTLALAAQALAAWRLLTLPGLPSRAAPAIDHGDQR